MDMNKKDFFSESDIGGIPDNVFKESLKNATKNVKNLEDTKYFTPNYDKALEQLDWLKFESHPIYYRKVRIDRFEICFNVDFYGQQLVYENWINENKITIDELSTLLVKGFEATCAKTICAVLTYDMLLLLTADFYYHNYNKKLHNFYKEQYEKFSGKKY